MSASRDLRLLSGAVLLSAAGDLLMVVVLSLRVHDLTGSGFAVAAVFATLMAPIVLLAPLAGRLVDRTETRRLLLAVSLAQALVAGALVFAGGLAPILALTTLLGAGAALILLLLQLDRALLLEERCLRNKVPTKRLV